MHGFRKRLRTAISHSNFDGRMKDLSKEVGCGDKTLYNIINNEELDKSKTGPGLFLMARVAEKIGASLDQLVGNTNPAVAPNDSEEISPEYLQKATTAILSALESSAGKTSVDALLRLHTKSGGRLEAFEPHLEFCDQYSIPKTNDQDLNVIAIGSRSLSAITMGHNDRSVLQEALLMVDDEELKRRWQADYSEASQRGSLCTVETLNVQMPNQPTRVKMDFTRCLLRVSDGLDNRLVLNFSFLIV